jgi:hypothetical protein
MRAAVKKGMRVYFLLRFVRLSAAANNAISVV